MVTEAINAIEIQDVPIKVTRIGEKRNDGRSRSIRLSFDTEETKKYVLDKAKNMSKVQSEGLRFDPKSVFFSPDLTKLQRECAFLYRQKRRAKDRRRQDQNCQSQHNSPHRDGSEAAHN